MLTRKIGASEQKALGYLMFFVKMGLVPAEGWDHQEVLLTAGETEETSKERRKFTRRFVFDRKMAMVEGQVVRLKNPVWRMIVEMRRKEYKEDGEWEVTWIDVSKQGFSGGFQSHSFYKDELQTIDRLIKIHQEFVAMPIVLRVE